VSTTEPVTKREPAKRISQVFNGLFAVSAWTVMVGGGAEPLYVPASGDQPARLVYTRNYAASALHEAAHWCIAGAVRRRQVDYGYHYDPSPRSTTQRQRFFGLELRCQALELLFTAAAGQPFQVSIDDLDAPEASAAETGAGGFDAEVRAAAVAMHRRGLPPRAAQLRGALAAEFNSAAVVALG
jgi:elongation factor P hydroxylase